MDAQHEPGPAVFYDASCGLCTGSAAFIAARDRGRRIRLVPIQSGEGEARLSGMGLDPADPSTMVLIDARGRAWVRSDAALRVARLLGPPWSLAGVLLLVPRPLRDAAYRLVARNRRRLGGGAGACPLPPRGARGRPNPARPDA